MSHPNTTPAKAEAGLRKVLFLDIDGVCNCSFTPQRFQGYLGIDSAMATRVKEIIFNTGCKVVLSSTWRLTPAFAEEVRDKVCTFIDVTPDNKGLTSRGTEIKQWLSEHPEVTQYAILDDNTDFLDGQPLFKTEMTRGLTDEIVESVTAHLNEVLNRGEK